MQAEKSGPSLLVKALAVVVLAIAAWLLLKFAIGFVAWLATRRRRDRGGDRRASGRCASCSEVAMVGGEYLVIALFFGLAGGVVGRLKGSSFWLWFSISAIVPVLGLIAAVLYRVESDELRKQCPRCGQGRSSSTTPCACGAGPSSTSPRSRSSRESVARRRTSRVAILVRFPRAGKEVAHACGRCRHGVPEGGRCRRRIRVSRRREPPDVRRVRRRGHPPRPRASRGGRRPRRRGLREGDRQGRRRASARAARARRTSSRRSRTR